MQSSPIGRVCPKSGPGDMSLLLAAQFALPGRTVPPVPTVRTAFPLGSGSYLVVSGESDVSTNPQVRTLDASVPRYRAWRGRVGATVALGDWLGLVGNSDNSAELHLHVHAQRPGPAGAPLGGDPLPIPFDGRFPVRGDRIESP